MSKIPLDIQRKCERRWAARLVRSAPSATPQRHRLASQSERAAEPAKAPRKAGRLNQRD